MVKLIINADDFGYSKIFNEVILELIENKFVSSTTVMVNWIDESQEDQIKKLLELASNVNVSVGLHLEFENEDYEKQMKEQYKKFVEIFGVKPSHIDTHKTHSKSYLRVCDFAKGLNVPTRNHGVLSEGVMTTAEIYYNGTRNDLKDIDNWLKTLKNDEFYEILFHPGQYDPKSASSLNKAREKDAQKIRDLHLLFEKYNIQLKSFNDLFVSKNI